MLALVTPLLCSLLSSSLIVLAASNIASANSEILKPCTPGQQVCGNAGYYNPLTQQCCPGATKICETTQACDSLQSTDSSTIGRGCCPTGHIVCADQCIDATTTQCCQNRSDGSGSCPIGHDCCNGMCCEGNHLCIRGFDGDKCWANNADSF